MTFTPTQLHAITNDTLEFLDKQDNMLEVNRTDFEQWFEPYTTSDWQGNTTGTVELYDWYSDPEISVAVDYLKTVTVHKNGEYFITNKA